MADIFKCGDIILSYYVHAYIVPILPLCTLENWGNIKKKTIFFVEDSMYVERKSFWND